MDISIDPLIIPGTTPIDDLLDREKQGEDVNEEIGERAVAAFEFLFETKK